MLYEAYDAAMRKDYSVVRGMSLAESQVDGTVIFRQTFHLHTLQ